MQYKRATIKNGGVIMNCENEFCIYNRKNKCILDDISLDIQGKCEACIYVDIPADQLEKLKEEQLL